MRKCLELSCLPKPTSGTKSIKFKRTTPGCVSKLIYSRAPPNPNCVLDPTHPALHFKPVQYAKAFPWRSYPGFSLRAVPKSLLEKPSYPAPNPPFVLAPPRSVYLDKGEAREGKEDARDGAEFEDGRDGVRERPTEGWVEEKDRISMSLVNVASLAIGGRALRVNVYNKFKNAIALVATRGADVERGPDGVKRIVFRDNEAGLNWILRDWTYICRPDPQINLMPYTELIPGIRRALEDIYVPGQRLEKEWGAPAALQMARLLGSLGPLGGDVPVQKASHKLDKRQAQVKELLDELAEQGITEPELCAVPPGHTLLEGLLRRYKALVEEMRTEGVAEAERSTLSPQPPPTPKSSQNESSNGFVGGRAFGREGREPRELNVTNNLNLPGREMIKARVVRPVAKQGNNVSARKSRPWADR